MSIIDLFRRSRREARRQIEVLLRRGLLSLDEIATQVGLGLDGEVADEVLSAMVRECWDRMSSAPVERPTAMDRLQAAFDALEAEGVMARHHPVEGRSDAHALIEHELDLAGQGGRTYRGYCFYDRPLARMMSEGGLAFCFGPGSRLATYAEAWRRQVEVACAVAAALRAQGFEVEWSGNPEDVVSIAGVEWTGARDEAGAPLVASGVRLQGEAGPRDRDVRAATTVFVSCPSASPEAHRFLAAVADRRGASMYGSAEAIDSVAAVAVAEDGMLLDLAAGQADPGPRGIMRRRDLAGDCDLLLSLTPTIDALDCDWWSQFPPERRLAVVTGRAGAAEHDGSVVMAIDVATGEGIDELLRALCAAARAGGSPPA